MAPEENVPGGCCCCRIWRVVRGRIPKMPTLFKVAKWSAVVLAGLFAVILLVLGVWSILENAGMDEMQVDLAERKSRGEMITLMDVHNSYRPKAGVPNAAAYYGAATSLMWDPDWKTDPLPGVPVVGQAKLPPLGEPVPAEMISAIEVYLKRQESAVDLVEKGTQIDYCVFDLDFSKGMGMLLPHLGKMRKLQRVLMLKAVVQAEAGDADGAADTMATMFRFAAALQDEPILISQLVRYAMVAHAVEALERALAAGNPSEEALVKLDAAIAAGADIWRMRRAMMSERAMGLDVCRDLVNGEVSLQDIDTGDATKSTVVSFLAGGLLKANAVNYAEAMNRVVDGLDAPPAQAMDSAQKMFDEIEADFIAAKQSFTMGVSRIISGMLIPALGKACIMEAASNQDVAMARIAVAIERFKLAEERLPGSLEELAPKYLATVPADILDGGKVKFRREGAGCTVYNAGLNRKDDGGAHKPEEPRGNQDGDFDRVFRIVR